MSVVEELAERLWVARQRAQPLAVDGNWLGVDHRTALEIADLLYRRCSVPPDPREVAAWKLGALDEPTQSRLGLPGPLFAPVLPDRLHTDVTALPVRLAELVDPKLEAEIGIRLDADGMRLAPCVEIADCRFAGWALPPGGAPADFGLQGSMVFGPVVEPVAEVHVEVRRDGLTVGAGGESLTLTAAHVNVFIERPASLIANKQAEGRSVRPGQDERVLIQDIIPILGWDKNGQIIPTIYSHIYDILVEKEMNFEEIVRDKQQLALLLGRNP